MQTKLGRFSSAVMEACWLAALIVVPVFFNIYSSRIFEPDKITLLRTLSLVILAAWVVKLFEEGEQPWKNLISGRSWVEIIKAQPLLTAVIALALVYIVATIFSVTPRISLWGSYQRLQGTYSTLSYLVIFATMAANLRQREQVRRFISVAILASLPVSLYGILQRYQLDPIPWGGDVSNRIAANMGNSIFVGAYFVVVFPLTAIRIVESFESLWKDDGWQVPDFARATIYVFVAALQLIALYFTGSRGPWLGWAASAIFLWLGFSLIWRMRWFTVTGVSVALIAMLFLGILNIPAGPLDGLRSLPELTRLSHLLDAESRTGKVRSLIWQGAAEMVLPHQPLEFPNGRKDSFNFLRPLIGYGPESMYVAYNPFYPPELTLVEKRNATPDRSHNETWDSLAITGLMGLVVYLTLFGVLLYYGLKWLGLVGGERQRNLYLALYLSGGAISTIGFVLWRGTGFLGVALPFGMILGVIVYLIWSSLFGKFDAPTTRLEKQRAYLLLGLLAAIVAHFVEINFGIAIASTRTYSWAYTAMLFLVGWVLPQQGEFVESNNEGTPGGTKVDTGKTKRKDSKSSNSKSRKRRRSSRQAQERGLFPPEDWTRQALIAGVIVALLLSTLGFLYITNAGREPTAFGTIQASVLRGKSSVEGSQSFGLLALTLTTWLAGVVLLVSEGSRILKGDQADLLKEWGKMIAVALGVSLLLALIYWLWHASGLVALAKFSATTLEEVLSQVRQSESILTRYYVYLFLLCFGLAGALVTDWPPRRAQAGAASALISVGALILTMALAAVTNMRVVQADIAFKTAELFARGNTWPVAISIYNRANELAPNEDYYYLFLGRAYLEYAKTLDDPVERDKLIAKAAEDLRRAQDINPLNPDHTANLARLHSLWASTSRDPVIRQERANSSEEFFSRAVILKPNDAKLWDEWALLYMNVLNLPQEALVRLERAEEIDPFYDWTYALIGDYYARFVSEADGIEPEEQIRALENAAKYYNKALENSSGATDAMKFNYAVALGGVYSQLGLVDQAIAAYSQALEFSSNATDAWRVEEVLARLYAQRGDFAMALFHAQNALASAPEDQKERLQALVVELGGSQ